MTPSMSLAERSRRVSRGSIDGRPDNFPARRAFAGRVNNAAPAINRDIEGGQESPPHPGVHNPNALLCQLLQVAPGTVAEKSEEFRKKMAGNGNHTENEQDRNVLPARSGEADADFLRRLRKGDEAAFHELVDRFGQQLFRVAYSMTGNSADAEDVVQETFAAAFAGIGKFRGESSLKTWLMQILARQCARVLRSRARRMTIGIEKADQPTHDPAPASESRMDVIEMLQKLSPEHREVIVLRELQGMGYEEIAAALKI